MYNISRVCILHRSSLWVCRSVIPILAGSCSNPRWALLQHIIAVLATSWSRRFQQESSLCDPRYVRCSLDRFLYKENTVGKSINTTWGYHRFFKLPSPSLNFNQQKKDTPNSCTEESRSTQDSCPFFSPLFFFGNLWCFLCVYFSITKVHPIKWVVGQLVFFRQIVDINGRRFENGCAIRCKYVVI